MIKRLVVELNEALCKCPLGTQLALDIETSKLDGSYEFQIACTECKAYYSMPLSKLRALIKVADADVPPPIAIIKRKKPNLILLQGGAATIKKDKE